MLYNIGDWVKGVGVLDTIAKVEIANFFSLKIEELRKVNEQLEVYIRQLKEDLFV